jgi:sarcosine oxidase subunit gamma
MKGVGTVAALQQLGWTVPDRPDEAVLNRDGQCLLRLGLTEHWILANPDNPELTLAAPALPISGCVPVYCQDGRAWFALSGECRAEVMAKLCGVDLRPAAFPVGAVVQSVVARQNAVILHQQIGDQTLFSILCDSAAAEYLWLVLEDAVDKTACGSQDAFGVK